MKKTKTKLPKIEVITNVTVVNKPEVNEPTSTHPVIDTIHHVFIVDRSASMNAIKQVTISGLNEQIETIKQNETKFKCKQTVTLILFNHIVTEVLYNQSVSKLQKFNDESFDPAGCTSLNDAIGYTFSKLLQDFKNSKTTDILVNIFTDGEENNSKDYSQVAARTLIEQGQTNKWTVAFIGANQNVMHTATSYSIPKSNTMAYTSDHVGTQLAFRNLSKARSAYIGDVTCSTKAYSGSGQSINFFSTEDKIVDLTFPNAKTLMTADISGKDNTDDYDPDAAAAAQKQSASGN